MADAASVKKLKVAELREVLTAKGLSTKGNKQELVDRLTEHIEEGGDVEIAAETENRAPTDVITTEEDSLLDPDLEGIVPNADEEAALLDPEPKGIVTNADEEAALLDPEPKDEAIEEKKAADIGPPTLTPIAEPQVTEKVPVVAPKTLTEQERKQLRVERFSGSKSSSLSEDAKKAARAQRFGIESQPTAKSTKSTTGGLISSIPTGASAADVDKLKKRAERFGAVVSPVVAKSEQQARLLKRKERFGASTLSSTTTSTGNADLDAKKKKRAERFGI